jgi:ribosomal protein S18 acetylase RimI-like enzyme
MQSSLTTVAYSITRATSSDAREILELQHLAYQSEAVLYDDFSLPPLKQTLAELEDEFGYKTILKVAAQERLLGSVRFYEREGTCYIERFIVHPNVQNQGIGKALMKQAETLTSSNRLELFTGHKSEKNLRFYKSLGYETFRGDVVSDKLTLVFLEKFR